MFENSRSWQRWAPPRNKIVQAHLGYVPQVSQEDSSPRVLKYTLIAAVLLHVLLFLFKVTSRPVLPDAVDQQPRVVYAVKPVRFKPPPPKPQEQQQVPKTKRRKIPIPDPTPDEPEPLRVEELDLPETEVDDLVVSIPDAPPSRIHGSGTLGSEPLEVGGDVSAPKRIYAPPPMYTEDARKGRVQGVVILQAVIDSLGNVDSVSVVKGLPLGLTESAMDTVKQWRFEPARKNGTPVPVWFHLTVSFSLQ